jgi:hypothetical protein
MASKYDNPLPPPVKRSTAAAPDVVLSDEPPKYKRPLPLPGDKDYVTGQPASEEEADRIEKEVADKYAARLQAKERRSDEP